MSPRVPAARDRSGRRKIRAEDQWKDQEWGECRSLGLSHLSRRRAFGATLVLRLEPPRRCTSVADDSPLPPHCVPLSRTRSLAFLRASTAYMNSTSSANTFAPRRCCWGILSPGRRRDVLPLYLRLDSPARNKTNTTQIQCLAFSFHLRNRRYLFLTMAFSIDLDFPLAETSSWQRRIPEP